MAVIAYTRVSTAEQDTAAQRQAVEERHRVDRWFTDEAISGTVKALERPGFRALFDFVREGDVVVVPAIDRLGRNTVDVLTTVEALQAKDVTVISVREGFDLGTPMGKAMLTMLSAVAELERSNIRERQRAGLAKARAAGKRLGRKPSVDLREVAQWRHRHSASIATTARHFGCGESTVKRACRVHPRAAR